MKPIYTYTESEWNGTKYELTYVEYYLYDGPIELLCGATSGQKEIGAQQKSVFNQIVEKAGSLFRQGDQVFGDLINAYAPIVAAGPNQEGFDAQTMAALDSNVITQNGVAYRNASTAAKEAQAAVGGGNMALPSGASIGRNASIANAAAANTSNQLTDIRLKSKELGRQNFWAAAPILAGATKVYDPSIDAYKTGVGAGQAAADTQNQIAQAGNAWMGAVGGILGGAASGIVTGGMSNLGKGVGFFGGNAPAPS